MKPDWERDGIELYCGDCLDILPQLNRIDAVVTDPPYGIGYKSYQPNSIKYRSIVGDQSEFDPSPFLNYPRVVLWGGNNFANRLPIGGWIVWDKRVSEAADRMLGSPFELAWCSHRTQFKIIRLQHGGAKNADARNGDVANQPRVHPTQKPVRLMEACIELTSEGTICDPFLGSGTTAVACIRTGRQCIGIEIDEKYFEIAKRRIQRELKKPRLIRPKDLYKRKKRIRIGFGLK